MEVAGSWWRLGVSVGSRRRLVKVCGCFLNDCRWFDGGGATAGGVVGKVAVG